MPKRKTPAAVDFVKKTEESPALPMAPDWGPSSYADGEILILPLGWAYRYESAGFFLMANFAKMLSLQKSASIPLCRCEKKSVVGRRLGNGRQQWRGGRRREVVCKVGGREKGRRFG